MIKKDGLVWKGCRINMKKRAIVVLMMVLMALCIMSSTTVYADQPLCSGTLNCDNYTLEQVQKFYYNQLTSDEKALYDAITKATVAKPKFTVKIAKGYTKQELDFLVPKCMGAVVSDMPEKRMIWKRPLWHYDYNKKTGSLTINLEQNAAYSPYNYEKAMSNFYDMVSAVGKEGDTLTKVTKLAKIFAENVDYAHRLHDASLSAKSSTFNDSAMGVFLTNLAVCAGMSDGFKMLCDELGIPCIVVGNAGHAWNMILIDGKWYECDPTTFVEAEEFSVRKILQGTARFNQGNGAISEMFIAVMGDFEFPIVSQTDYECSDLIIVESSSLQYSFREPEPRYLYKINNDKKTCTITGYEGPQNGNLGIPAAIDGYKVTAIGEAAFARTKFDGNLIIPDTVTKISSEAFMYCKNLTGELKLPRKLNKIGEAAFLGCSSLSGPLALPDTVKTIGIEAFLGCSSLSGSLLLPDTIENIGRAAFYNCSGLTGDIHLPSKLTSLEATFGNCTGLTGTVYLPDNLKTWNMDVLTGSGISGISVDPGNQNFASVDGVLYNKDKTLLITCPPGKEGELKFPSTVTEISDSACNGCAKLTGTLKLPNSVTQIGNWAFQNTGFSGDLIIPNSVKHIGYAAFAGGRYTGELRLPNRLEYLGDWAFTNCAFTGDLIIPDSIREYEDYCAAAFHGCQFDKIVYNCSNTKFKDTINGLSGICCDISEVHNEVSAVTKNPTCQEEGLRTYTCKDCGAERIVPIEKHSYDRGIITKSQTCTEEGIRTYTCTVCGYQKTEAVEVHTYDAGVISKQPNCLEEGLKTYACTGCGFTKTEKIVDWDAHDEVKIPAVAATCKKSGKTAGKQCAICKTVFVAQKKIPAMGHKAGSLKVTVKATATKAGKKQSKCKNCNTVLKTVKIKKLSLFIIDKTYNGKKIKKTDIRVKTKDGKTIPAKYYTITNFKRQKNIGRYTYTIKFKQTCPEYKGTAKVKFEIKPPKTSLKKLTAGKRTITVYWTNRPASQVSGYEVMLSRNKNFNGATHTYGINKKYLGFCECDSLKSKKTYYVRIRCYKYVNGVKLYSDWSAAKTIKTQ